MHPVISIIMPVYNVEDYLEEAIEGVLAQSFDDFELICVDDGSIDSSPSIVERYMRRDPRVRLMYQNNQGSGAARNHGLDQARGDYVIFLDSDDIFYENLLQDLYAAIVFDESDVSICEYYVFKEGAPFHAKRRVRLGRLGGATCIECADRLIQPQVLQLTTNAPWNKLYRRAFLLDVGVRFQEIPSANDALFTSVSLLYARKVSLVRIPLLAYRVRRGGGSLTDRAMKNPACSLEAAEAIERESLSRGLDGLRVVSLYRKCFILSFSSVLASSDISDLSRAHSACKGFLARLRNTMTDGLPALSVSERVKALIVEELECDGLQRANDGFLSHARGGLKKSLRIWGLFVRAVASALCRRSGSVTMRNE